MVSKAGPSTSTELDQVGHQVVFATEQFLTRGIINLHCF